MELGYVTTADTPKLLIGGHRTPTPGLPCPGFPSPVPSRDGSRCLDVPTGALPSGGRGHIPASVT